MFNPFWVYLFISMFWPHHVACGILAPWPGIEPVPPGLEAQNLNHCTIRWDPFWVYFLIWCKKVAQFHFFASSFPLSTTPFIETIISQFLFYTLHSCLPYKLIVHISMDSFLGSLFCSIDLCVWFCASTIVFWLL